MHKYIFKRYQSLRKLIRLFASQSSPNTLSGVFGGDKYLRLWSGNRPLMAVGNPNDALRVQPRRSKVMQGDGHVLMDQRLSEEEMMKWVKERGKILDKCNAGSSMVILWLLEMQDIRRQEKGSQTNCPTMLFIKCFV